LHLRPAVKLVQVAKRFQSTIHLRCGEKIADLRSFLSIMALCATMGTGLDVEAVGEDEQDAARAVAQFFSSSSADGGAPANTPLLAERGGQPRKAP
jgi:phosphotransferase system HPr (HPr) family protein